MPALVVVVAQKPTKKGVVKSLNDLLEKLYAFGIRHTVNILVGQHCSELLKHPALLCDKESV